MQKTRPWLETLLLLAGALVYTVTDFRHALPEWFNWIMAILLPIASIFLLIRYEKTIHSFVTISITLLTFGCGFLPLLANMNVMNTAYQRDFDRVRIGMLEKKVALQMGDYRRDVFSTQDGMKVLEFRKYQAPNSCIVTRFEFSGGKLLHKSWTVRAMTSSEHEGLMWFD